MTEEEINLLQAELCARMPYGVRVLEITNVEHGAGLITSLATISKQSDNTIAFRTTGTFDLIRVEFLKPFLRPLDSMTDDEVEQYRSTCHYHNVNGSVFYEWTWRTIDWFNQNHFDYRHLIPKGLAFDVIKEQNMIDIVSKCGIKIYN